MNLQSQYNKIKIKIKSNLMKGDKAYQINQANTSLTPKIQQITYTPLSFGTWLFPIGFLLGK